MIVLYKGARGKGKTLTMVKDAYNYCKEGYSIYANLNLSFGKYISSDDVLKLNRKSALRDCVLVIDEIELFFDSRSFSKEENRTFSHFLQQIRKRNIIILCTCQYINLVDLRIRQQLDIISYPNFDKKSLFCGVNYFDLTKLEDNMSLTDFKPIFVIYNAFPVFSLYDTHEIL